MPIVANKNFAKPTIGNKSAFKVSKNTKRPNDQKKNRNIKRKLKNDVHLIDDDDDDDEHYYYGDFENFNPFQLDDEDDPTDSTQAKSPTERSLLKAASDKDNKEYVANPSKNNYSLTLKKHSKHTTTTPSTTTASNKDCSPATKFNYHYHMYMVKPISGHKNKLKPTTTANTYPVFDGTRLTTADPKTDHYQTAASPIVQPTIVPSISYSHKNQQQSNPVLSYFEEDPNSDYFYQVVTSSSYIEPADSYKEISPKELSKSSHFDSDYYNSVLLSKILGLNPGAKAMPIENYATESSGKGPLVKYDKTYKNAKSVDASKVFQVDKHSKLYVTLDRPSEGPLKSKVESKQK